MESMNQELMGQVSVSDAYSGGQVLGLMITQEMSGELRRELKIEA